MIGSYCIRLRIIPTFFLNIHIEVITSHHVQRSIEDWAIEIRITISCNYASIPPMIANPFNILFSYLRLINWVEPEHLWRADLFNYAYCNGYLSVKYCNPFRYIFIFLSGIGSVSFPFDCISISHKRTRGVLSCFIVISIYSFQNHQMNEEVNIRCYKVSNFLESLIEF